MPQLQAQNGEGLERCPCPCLCPCPAHLACGNEYSSSRWLFAGRSTAHSAKHERRAVIGAVAIFLIFALKDAIFEVGQIEIVGEGEVQVVT